ncbi:hypothetical protein HOT31_gp016 [Microbacterium phage Hendrix]|uniref:Uncharacterized protein n=1 Tax=Microbacterium phage Hendrix TaxID=2182341 RepID=A0A2U8UUD0_9CAUD|nr:hypothetical protein HOT31_gp016 [Microbacterium phage Hendrix]AWN07687.1 hypothetical protein PBI_HENDRIX_16 [Microbacterium phage Hendrix]
MEVLIRVPHAEPKLDLLDHSVHPRDTPGGWSALCFAMDEPEPNGDWGGYAHHRRKGWRGPLYLHEKEKQYEGGASWYNAMLDAWQHDVTEHTYLVREQRWDEVIGGVSLDLGSERVSQPLGVPFRFRDRTVAGALLEFWDGMLHFYGWR